MKLKNGKNLRYGTFDMNILADKDIVDVISYLVNGGNNELNERRKYILKLK